MADEENLPCKIGFFLHIPFPPWDIVKIFPWEDMILQVHYVLYITLSIDIYRFDLNIILVKIIFPIFREYLHVTWLHFTRQTIV